MATSSSDPNPTVSKKRRRSSDKPAPSPAPAKWRSNGEAKTYSSRLLDALRRVSRGGGAPQRGRAVREAADRVLATAARGRTRWSRAILGRRRALRLKPKNARPPVSPGKVPAMPGELQRKTAKPAVERKEKVLGRLVPGGRRLGFPALLEETCDYIAALEMQVRAMSALAQVLSAAGSAGAPARAPETTEPA